jgi:hypothetical protein
LMFLRRLDFILGAPQASANAGGKALLALRSLGSRHPESVASLKRQLRLQASIRIRNPGRRR